MSATPSHGVQRNRVSFVVAVLSGSTAIAIATLAMIVLPGGVR